jgi:hypothetical protein
VVLKTEDEEELEIAEDETKEELAEELVEVIWLSAEVLVELEELLLLLEVETTDELLLVMWSLEVAPYDDDDAELELAEEDSGIGVDVGVDEGVDEALELELVLGLWTYS